MIVACTLLAALPAGAQPRGVIHTSVAARLAADPTHLRTLRAELERALDGKADGYTLDVSLVQWSAKPVNNEIEVRCEVKTFLSDRSGRVRLTSTSRATARGPLRDRELVQRDVLIAVAADVVKFVLKNG